MKLIDFQFTKINAERIGDLLKNYKIESNVNLENLESIKDKKSKIDGDLLKIKFNYNLVYSNLAKMELLGNIILKIEEKESKEILSKWKDKKLPDDFKAALFNIILAKCNVKALSLEDEIKIPYHLSLPKIGIKK